MLKQILTVMVAFAALVSFSTVSIAADEAPSKKVSYSAKKSGKVPFQDKAEDVAASADDVDPSEIEPAAGAHEIEEENDIAKKIKLPRK